jgi:hypothetical protein
MMHHGIGDSWWFDLPSTHDIPRFCQVVPRSALALLQPYAQRHGTWHSWAVHGALSTNSLAALGAPLLPAEANADVPGPGWSDGGWMFMGIYNGYKMLKLWCYWISEIINGFELIYDIDGYYCIIYCSKKTIGDEADPSSGGLDWWLQPSGLGWLFGKWWLVGTWWFFREVSSIECRSHHPLFWGLPGLVNVYITMEKHHF